MRVFRNTWFARFSRKQGISDARLAELIDLKHFTEVHDHDKEIPK